MVAKTRRDHGVSDDYLELIKRFPLAPIRGERHFKEAVGMIDELSIIDEEKLTAGQADYLLVLSDLVERYEDRHFQEKGAFGDGVQALAYLMEQRGMSASDLGRLLGSRSLGSAILRRERELSKGHVVKLARYFGISTDLLLGRRGRLCGAG
jgi:HTH-type transcriptional regulator/antitoxin HigA